MYIEVYYDIGDPVYECQYCKAIFWYDERQRKDYKPRNPTYSICCFSGKIKLPRLLDPPRVLGDLLFGRHPNNKHFKDNIHSFNSMFSFTSLGAKVETNLNQGGSPPIFTLSGQNYHRIGSLMPKVGGIPKFAQLYIYDTDNEVTNRILAVRDVQDIDTIRSEVVSTLMAMFDDNNILVKSFRMARDKLHNSEYTDLKLKLIGRRVTDRRTYNLPTVSEVAALIVGDFDESLGQRDILIESVNGDLKRISEMHPSYLPLQYPLLFPYGEDGYRDDISISAPSRRSTKPLNNDKKVTFREFFSYRLHERHDESSHILSSRRLFQQFVVDAYTMIESWRLNYIRMNQKQLRCDLYKGLSEAILRGENNPATQGKRVILPSSFTGGVRYKIQNYQDAMAICRWAGYPDLFITFTCNPKWPEIVRYLESRSLKAEDRPDIVCRVFKMKLDQLMKDIRQNKIFGTVRAAIYTIEFQKRGLPHAHILIFLSTEDKYPTGEDIDRIISAEIPDQTSDECYYNYVREFMIHGPCGAARKNSPCMDGGKCTKHFPKKYTEITTIDKDGYPSYRRRDNGRTVEKSGVLLDNRHVVPHNKYLLLTYGGHINVEWCNQSRSIKYLFKYINKGDDRVTLAFCQSTEDEAQGKIVDEVKMYYDCRYISPCEASWRIFSYDIQYKHPPVERLSFHLPNEQTIIFSENDALENIVNRSTVGDSMFLAWFEANKKYPQARLLTYSEFPTLFVWKKDIREWVPRKKGISIGRIFYIHPGSGEIYYLRLLLNIVRGPTCFEDIKRVHGVQYDSFRDACFAYGLLDDDREYSDGIIEASQWSPAQSLRHLFANIFFVKSMNRPEVVWDKCWQYLSDDILYMERKRLRRPDLHLSEEQIKNHALAEIEKILLKCGHSLREFSEMPYPDAEYLCKTHNSLINDELSYDRSELEIEHASLLRDLTSEQRHVYHKIIEKTQSDLGGVFFVYGYGGTGKTFVWKTLSAAIRSKGDIVLNVASSGIASLLLPGGRTAHSRFAIPVQPNEDTMCSIKQGSPLAELLIRCKLIIWDEAPMMHKHCFEALDRTLRDIMRFKNSLAFGLPFGGKTIVFGGDFRQILPVIAAGSRQDIVNASINASYIWKDVQVLRLTKNMRLHNMDSSLEATESQEFSNWVAAIGDGVLGGSNDGHAEIVIPDDIHLKYSIDPIETIVKSTYPSSIDSPEDLSYLDERAILAPTLDVVEMVNRYMISLNKSESREYLSSDKICSSDGILDVMNDVHTPEYLNSLKCSGLPNHVLNLKVGTPIMLLRNIDHSLGLCNGTRLILTKLGNHVLEAKILAGSNAGQKVLIPRMSLTPTDLRLPFKFQRRQFPIIVSYAMTINKSQGQSLSHVGLFLKKPVFSHGQLYVAVSRVRRRSGLKILICDKDNKASPYTTNVVYKEVFHNL